MRLRTAERARRLKSKLLSSPGRVEFHYKFFFSFSFISCFPRALARVPQAAHERALQTSHQPHYSLLSLIMALIPSRWINIFIPSTLKPEGSSALESKKEKREKKWRAEEGAQEKGWQMEGWINSEMNQQQSNKAAARFSGSSHNSSDLSPPWHNYHSPPNYFFFLNWFLMAGCVFLWSCFCEVEGFFRELLCNLVASDCVHRLHRKGEGGGEGGGEEGGGGGGGGGAGGVVSREWARPQTSTSLAQ